MVYAGISGSAEALHTQIGGFHGGEGSRTTGGTHMASTTNRPPVIAIVGPPNVGKSSLLNELTGKRISIGAEQPGVTRDRISVPREIDGLWVELVDTGGYGFVDPDQLTEHIAHQIELAMA